MFIVKGKKIDFKEELTQVRKEFEKLEDAEKYANEYLDGYTITDADTGEGIIEQEDSNAITEASLDNMYPDRHDKDFDQDQISGEDFFKD
ncbi:MAG: hypothetical protein HOA61_03260 [Bacteroidetes bacterium]|jgi:hypothetical protein|nr:hypothetical protein [Bacteroidota bacterium]MBT6835038.1 hypothetical protein [Bacteroidota bacterium]